MPGEYMPSLENSQNIAWELPYKIMGRYNSSGGVRGNGAMLTR